MQLKTVGEVAKQYYDEINVMTLEAIITQDRADIRAVLRELFQDNYEHVLDPEGNETPIITLEKALTLIDTLLPGDVSK